MGLRTISIPEQRDFDGVPFPLTLTPTEPTSMPEWANTHRDSLLSLIASHDAVLLRGFTGIDNAMDFSKVVNSLRCDDFEMGCSAAPRTAQAPGVFTANEAPPSEPIPFHHEMAQCDEQPSYVIFYCERPATTDGATPIIPSNAVAKYLRETHPDAAEKLARLGVQYARTLPAEHDPSSPIGKSWKAAFSASSRADAEAAMAADGTSWTWLEGTNDDVRTVTKRRPCLVTHAATGKEIFFNAVVAAREGWVDSRNDPNEAVLYGDGSPLDAEAREALEACRAYMASHRVAFEWQAGDVLLLDNFKAMHSRQTFVGPRRVLASLWGGALQMAGAPAPPPPFEEAAADEGDEEKASDEEAGDDPAAVAARATLPLRVSTPARSLRSWLRRRVAGSPARDSAARTSDSAMRLRGGAIASSAEAPVLRLTSGAKMPAVGLGLWKVPKAACAQTVTAAIKAGYRHLDCACDYGNEAEVGEGIRAAIAEGVVTREELWVTSKLWNTYHRAEHVEPACRKTLSDLGLDYVDLYLVHFPIALKYVPFAVRYPPEWIHDPDAPDPKMEMDRVPFRETWEAMEALHALGLAKEIGVCNMNTAGLRELLSYASTPPSVLQIELHPYLQQPALLRFAKEHGIAVTGFSPLGAGSYVELSMATAADSALADPTVTRLASSKGISPAQLILTWAIQRGYSVVPKSTKAARLAENLDVGRLVLSDDEMGQMAALDKHRRYNDPGVFCLGMGAFCPIYD